MQKWLGTVECIFSKLTVGLQSLKGFVMEDIQPLVFFIFFTIDDFPFILAFLRLKTIAIHLISNERTVLPDCLTIIACWTAIIDLTS
jgi:hypothetical protein